MGLTVVALSACNMVDSAPQTDTSSQAIQSSSPDNRARGQLAMSFAWIGGCRLAAPDWNKVTNPSSANVPELSQTLYDLASLPRTPDFFFFPGDLISGFGSASLIKGQLDGWATLYKTHPSGIANDLAFIPIAGNHETLLKIKEAGGGSREISNPVADQPWIDWLGENNWDAFAGNGPTPAGDAADELQDDQSKMTYSFDVGPVHFVVVNTDTWTTQVESDSEYTEVGWVPLAWIQADIEAAQANPHVRDIFVIGHKPLVVPNGKTDSESVINPLFTAKFEAILDANSKVRAFLASHAHLFDARKLPGQRGVWQVIGGNGGSPLDATWTEPNPYFGFAVVNVYTNGRIEVQPYGRPAPNPYNSTDVQPATPKTPFDIYEPGRGTL
jgi:hypothetical protein